LTNVKSNQKKFSLSSPASSWRTHCQKSGGEFDRLEGPAAQVRRAERFEAQAISQLLCDFETTEIRASALRLISALRNCSLREVATFFAVETEIVVTALMLQPDTLATVAVPIMPSASLIKAA
jgi:hypothetical protein